MVKIVVTQDLGLTSKEIEELKKLGDLTIYNELSKTAEEWLKRCQGADIICTGKFGLKTEKTYELKNVFFALPFVGVGFFDKERLKRNKITVSYCPGCNKEAVSEWIIGMIINLLRDLPEMINNTTLPKGVIPKRTLGLTNKKITIIGKGNIGSHVGKLCETLGLQVNYFYRGDNLIKSVEKADIIVNTLSKNPNSENLLNEIFFKSLKKGAFFVSVTSKTIFDTDAMLKALDQGILSKIAIDAGGIQVGDVTDEYYKKLLKHPKVLVTPHIAYNTDLTDEISNKMMIENIKAWLNKNPINILK
jgi:D-lactate dehydrogenase